MLSSGCCQLLTRYSDAADYRPYQVPEIWLLREDDWFTRVSDNCRPWVH